MRPSTPSSGKRGASLPPARKVTRQQLKSLLRLPQSDLDLAVRHLVTTERKGYKIEKLELLSEPGIYVPVWVFVPPQADRARAPLLWVDERIRAVTLERMLLSFRTLTATDRYTHNASIFLKDGLLHCDLPQVAGLIAPRPVTLADPLDAMKRSVPRSEAAAAYAGLSHIRIA